MTDYLQVAYELGVKLAFSRMNPDQFITEAISATEDEMLGKAPGRNEAPVYEDKEPKQVSDLASTKEQRLEKHPDEPNAAWFRDRHDINPNGRYA